MNKLTTTALSAITGLTLAAASFASTAAMNPTLERQLVSVCKAAKNDNRMDLQRSIEHLHSNHRTMALRLMCNGQNVIEFAESYGANKTANALQRSLGSTSITDIASNAKLHVSFEG